MAIELRKLLERRLPRLLEADIVVGRHSIITRDGMAGFEQTPRKMKADEAGSSRNEISHEMITLEHFAAKPLRLASDKMR
jgi:hypothetical protein